MKPEWPLCGHRPWQRDGTTAARIDHLDRSTAAGRPTERTIDEGDPRAVRRPGRIRIPTLAPREDDKWPARALDLRDHALISDGDPFSIGGQPRCQHALDGG